MIFCYKCGKKAEDSDEFCMSCGTRLIKEWGVEKTAFSQQQTYTQPMYQPQSVDVESTGLNVISFLFPLIGAILYLVLKDDKPRKAKACGKWALISVITSIGMVMFVWLMIFLTFIFRAI